jgi:DNA repair protein RadC
MKYGKTASSEQMTFLGEEHTTKPKQASIPVYKVTLVREGKMPWGDTRMRNSQMVSAILHQYLEGTDRENLCAVLLNQKNEITGISTISIGSLTSSVAHPREIFKVAILANCASLIIVHNHPSGDPQPSKEDRALTARLLEAGKILGIPLVDSIIIGDGNEKYFSFADEGLLERC